MRGAQGAGNNDVQGGWALGFDRVERFAILVVSDEAGATVLEAPPPQR